MPQVHIGRGPTFCGAHLGKRGIAVKAHDLLDRVAALAARRVGDVALVGLLEVLHSLAIAVRHVLVAAIVGLIVAMYRSDRNFSQAKLPLVLLIATVVVLAGVLLTDAYTDSVQDQYLRDHNRPTLDEYFDALEQQKQ